MNSRLFRSIGFVLLLIGLLAVTLVPVAAQGEGGTARVRIGYFAFDPQEYDTFINGEMASFNNGWGYTVWRFPEPSAQLVCCSTTPFMDVPAGVHEFVFAPAGAGIAAASAAPQEVTFVPGHVHSLAVIGGLEDGSLLILNIDETEYAVDTDLSESFFRILVNDLAGSPATVISDDEGSLIPYGQFVAGASPASTVGNPMRVEVVTEPPRVIVERRPAPLPPGLTNLNVLSGTYPGLLGRQFALYWNWGYSGAVDTVDAGSIAPGDTVDGEITEIAQRARYTLTLDADTTLNIYVRTGHAVAERPFLGWGARFNPMLYVYDAQGRLTYWNDELDMRDGGRSLDAGFEELRLPAGSYLLEVAAALDSQAGTYTLEVAHAK